MVIPYHEFVNVIEVTCGGLKGSKPWMIPAPNVNILNLEWLRNDFLSAWVSYKYEYAKQQNKPLENNPVRGICDEIAGRCKSLLMEASRKEMNDGNACGAVAEVNIIIPAGYALNQVPGFGGHRTLIVGVTEDNISWRPIMFEQQLTYASYKDTTLDAAVGAGVTFFDLWV